MSLALQHSPADVSRTVLILAGVGTDPSVNAAWPIYAAGEPPTPDEVMTVYDTTARSDGRIMKGGEGLFHYGIQVRIRSLTHRSGVVQAEKTKVIMNEQIYSQNLFNFLGTPYSYYFHCFTNLNLMYLSKEVPPSKRSLFTINGYCTLKRIQ